jgi:hypothetical protein
MNNKNLKLLFFVFLVSFCVLLFFNFPSKGKEVVKNELPQSFNETLKNTKEITIQDFLDIKIVFSDGKEIFFKSEFKEGESLAKIIRRVLEKGGVNFETKNFWGSMGEFVHSINGFKNTKDNWWQYWVNDRYAKVGISNYFPKKQDKIVFKLIEYKDSYEN